MLTVQHVADPEHPSWHFAWRELPVGSVKWSGLEWFWFYQDHGGEEFGGGIHIAVDPEAEADFISQRQSIAKMDEPIRSVMEAELKGRLRIYADETKDMALMYGRSKARQRGACYDSLGVTADCNGYVDMDGTTMGHEDGPCPVHGV